MKILFASYFLALFAAVISCLQTLEGHTDLVNALCALSDDRLASGSDDVTVRIWSVSSSACLQTLEGHTEGVFALCALRL